MSFREKSAWISLLTMALVYGRYYWRVLHQAGGGTGDLLMTVVALVVLQVGLTIAAAIWTPRDANAPVDERERLILLKATRTAYAGLATGIACACFFAGFQPPILFKANSLLLILVTAEMLRAGSQIVQFRREA